MPAGVPAESVRADAAVGIDVGGTKCLGVVLAADGSIDREALRPTPHGPDAIIETLAEVVEELIDGLPVSTHVGVGVPGLVTRAGVLRAAPNLVDIAEFDVAGRLATRLHRSVVVDNDATCATLSEWRLGAAVGARDVVLVTLGTGIGGGLVCGGKLQHGANGFAGEYGHVVVHPEGPPCPCGRRGCWERYASGSGLGRLAREAAVGGRADRLVELAGGDPEAVRGEHVRVAAREGDDQTRAVIDEFGRWVALGLVNLTNTLDPELIVLGGGLAADGDLYVGAIRHWFTEILYSPELRPHPHVEFARLGPQAGAIGAALLDTAV